MRNSRPDEIKSISPGGKMKISPKWLTMNGEMDIVGRDGGGRRGKGNYSVISGFVVVRRMVE